MRKTLPVLALLATASASRAVLTGTATSIADVSYTLGAGLTAAYSSVSVDGRAAGEYIHNFDGTDGAAAPSVFEFRNDVTGDPAPVLDPTRYTTASDGGAFNYSPTAGRVQLSATATGSYLAAASDTSDTFLFRLYGSRAFLRVANGGSAPATVTFNLNKEQRYADLTTDIPYDLDKNLGQVAFGGGYGDVVVSTEDASDDYFAFANTFDTGNAPDGRSAHLDTTFAAGVRSFTLQPGDSFEYEVFASAYINLEDDHRPAPVPEPSAFAALGVGALCLLRRRRKA